MHTVRITCVIGNPKQSSRTRQVAEAVAAAAARAFIDAGLEPAVDTLEVSYLGPHLLGWGAPEAATAVQQLIDADLIVVASPVFKATYSGLLKLLFDQVGAGQLSGSLAVPVMVGAAPQHALAVETHLRPLLMEVGASCPTAGIFVLESTLDSLDEQLDTWAAVALPRLVVGVGLGRTQASPG